MSRAEYDRLIADINNNPALRQEFDNVEDPAAWFKLATSKGYDISWERVQQVISGEPSQLTDEEMEAVAGGVENPLCMPDEILR